MGSSAALTLNSKHYTPDLEQKPISVLIVDDSGTATGGAESEGPALSVALAPLYRPLPHFAANV